jgi:hypothetical protein
MPSRTRVLITVMTYPHPSQGYQELVCTAGITVDNEWVRLYPVDYRYRPIGQRFRKYQWIDIALFPTGSGNDKRKESRKPVLDSIQVLGEPLSPNRGWAERRSIIDNMPHHTVHQLQQLYDRDRTSLGLVRPARILDLKVEKAEHEWKPAWQKLFDQMRLFGPSQKPLRKIPYKFSYQFECEDSTRPHNAMIEDWELGMLFLNEASRLGSDEAAAESVRSKFLDEMCRDDKDTRFYMGTKFPYNTWLVLGVFWPPATSIPTETVIQESLF